MVTLAAKKFHRKERDNISPMLIKGKSKGIKKSLQDRADKLGHRQLRYGDQFLPSLSLSPNGFSSSQVIAE